ncbi:ABSCISIC ACID-INSENSITIVE 5-like protein 6 [Raphanus sativus]|uniref:ABSCISIC ACID-INSENSITIVE 5-like protein 6 isoform X2 n=1 Tax=Raphanus sativus TaxID=3726 RepID=A0A6J0NIN4_RAPSA|nr:PREDICTED: ABSCISIC ACID-INSENSITIVE 5-like protein 6 [Raphanus sativus]XP_018483649.1 ABSCISIC ACID-INSENSITIVE 5-like protein 6 isoform X2 [Raphanus sativus]XP_056863357.1 ABSCISIC ACID-INSENSITIVE 5-like protein 6 isoform X2 [Raphanus sativus]KAJ4867914.1 ABSCISIC ACID-INSENSITIVE 5-like protein 6 [Raphanus sativus]KAJ4898994.1 ABSCISIC ACID-INSENSITIVE 5-like protein 6 [Raphanus sativus]
MGSRMNFVDVVRNEVFNAKQPTLGTGLALTRQNSVFSLTFDEFQNSWGGGGTGIGKDFGSMNMDELLKNIWTAEESHFMMNSVDNNGGLSVGVGGETGGLQRQGSINLPRTISQKRVDDVWKELMREEDETGASGVPQRQQTLGEMTLEEFLLKAGVVREEPQQGQVERIDNFDAGFYGFGSNAGLDSAPNGFGPNQPCGATVRPNLLTTQTLQPQKVQQPQQLIQKQERPFPKQTTVAFSNTVGLDNRSQPPTQEVKPSILGVRDRPMNNNLLQAVDFKTGVTVPAVSPGSQMSPNLTPKSNMDASLLPVPYMFGRGRKTGAVLEKVIERRQKRMIKNRESAARSRARKQAYTLELEAEVAQLKELNEELHRKQVEIMEKQKKQLLEPMRQPLGCKRQCLRRTSTGPW